MKEIGFYFLLILLFLLFILSIIFVITNIVSFFNRNKQAPYINSFNKDINLIKKLHFDKGKTLVDLGCGDGKMLRFFVKNYGLVASGYEINIFAVCIAKLINNIFGYKHIKIIKSDFKFADLSTFDYIYVYLLPKQMAFMEDWIWKNKKPGALIISNSFDFQKHKAFDKIQDEKKKRTIFLYK